MHIKLSFFAYLNIRKDLEDNQIQTILDKDLQIYHILLQLDLCCALYLMPILFNYYNYEQALKSVILLFANYFDNAFLIDDFAYDLHRILISNC